MRTLVWGMVIAGALALALVVTVGSAADAAESTTSISISTSPSSSATTTQVEGAVLDREGHGVGGATVFARPVGLPVAIGVAGRPFETLTDQRGRFHLEGLPPGTYWFIAFHPQYAAGSSPAIPVVGKLEVAIHLDDEPASA